MNKASVFLIGALVLSCLLPYGAFARQTPPDTLVINTRLGKIILISDSLQRFKAVNNDVLIRKALEMNTKDSLGRIQERTSVQASGTPAKKRPGQTRVFKLLPAFGAGLIRDKISPFLSLSLDFAPQRQDYYLKYSPEYTFINLGVSSFFTFLEDEAGAFHTNHNIFLEGSLGNRMNNNVNNYGNFSELAAGIGYLVYKEGTYFKGSTWKLFVSIGIKRSFIRIRPELYITDNFRKVFPGLTLKMF
ncbi:MAG: hypothetical protein J7621_08385 [Niastella sp.]|nr:hypothetical protein [Niastella sp.]